MADIDDRIDYSKQVPGQTPNVAPRYLDTSRPIQQASTGNPYQTTGGQSMFNQLGAKPYERTNVTDGKDFKRMGGYVERPDSYEYDRLAREARIANNGPTRRGMQGHNEADARGWAAEQQVREMQQRDNAAYAQSMQGAYGKAAAHNQAEGGYASAEQRQGMQGQANYAVNQANNASNQAQAAANNASLEARDADKNNVLRQAQSVTHDANRMNAALRAAEMRNTQAERMHTANEAARKAGKLPYGTSYTPLNYDQGAFDSTYNKIGARVDSLGNFGDNVGNLGQAAIQATQSGNPALGAPPTFAGGAVNAPAQPNAPAPAFTPGPAAGSGNPFAPTDGDAPFAPTDAGVIPAGVAPVAGGGVPAPTPVVGTGAPSIYGGAPTATTVPAVVGGGVAPAVAAASEGNGFVGDATVRPPADPAIAAAAPSPGVPPEAVAAATNGGALGGGANSAAPAVPNTPAAWADIAAMSGGAFGGGALGGGANSAAPAVPNTPEGRAKIITQDVERAKRISTAADHVLTTMNYGAAAKDNASIDPDRVRDHQFAMNALATVDNLPNDIRNDQDLLNRIAFRVQLARAERTNSQHLVPGAGGEVVLDQDRYTMGRAPGFWDNVSGVFKGAAEGAAAGTSNGNEIGPYGALSGLIRGYNRWGQREITSPGGDPFYVDSDAILAPTAQAIHAQQQAEQQLAQQYAPYARFFHSPLQ